ncbi:hypothetical protein JCM15457_1189 [Liquorilactobacillus sucicola DSM 21376 = JCM 15457]|uniref:Uncharacterized protein n=1 Tax=Liquorilactobacillus sucicola DSM 21376 = JCM 15457 TaxID=1423806 RepID=A0A023CXH1_9LACO|nr:hypothetical protein [Liquorilactobacillus sucicola]KRN06327.1 hypothetical protein FD15_GL001529 [Liquorilactobacillus sucicola DSM 21376 = JCM 15457]GAJ26271.1 hypothetical protein JCM15457_1189 [Liquorilactobacillus sucicola DSM 21376 = JCM 15457]
MITKQEIFKKLQVAATSNKILLRKGNSTKVPAYISSWLLFDEDFKTLHDYPDDYSKVAHKLSPHNIMLGLNAGEMSQMTSPWFFFHARIDEKTGKVTCKRSETILKKVYSQGFVQDALGGAYMTDIFKYNEITEDGLLRLGIEKNSKNVKLSSAVKKLNFSILYNELKLAAKLANTESVNLVPLGGDAYKGALDFLNSIEDVDLKINILTDGNNKPLFHYSSRKSWQDFNEQLKGFILKNKEKLTR